jgi:hypothetical protein
MRFLMSWALVPMLHSLPHCQSQTLEWTRQLGTSENEFNFNKGVSADGLGNVYVSGHTQGSLAGPNHGDYDAFVAKYDGGGGLQWTQQLGTSQSDFGLGISADGLGNVYLSGETSGSLGRPNLGSSDAFVTKYDAAGSLLWTRQLGTSSRDENTTVSADGLGNVYLSGSTEGSLGGANAGNKDVFVAKYKADGSLEWTRQFGTSAGELSEAVSADGLGNVYLSGWTSGSLGGANSGGVDAFVAKYDSAGTMLWTRQLGTSLEEYSFDVSADGLGNVYLTGTTDGSLGGASHGFRDAFVAKYDGAGNQLWTRQLGSDSNDGGSGVSADSLGNVYLSGETGGALGGPSDGGLDSYLAKYDAAGNLRWARQFGPGQNDASEGVSADGLGSVFFSGYANRNFGGPNAGGLDVYVAKLSDAIPEPHSGLLLSVAMLATYLSSQRKRLRRCSNAATARDVDL